MGKVWQDRVQDYDLKGFLVHLMNDLKTEIISEVKVILNGNKMPEIKKWIKSAEVKQLLNVSHGKLQMMRNSKTIAFTKIGGTIYYNIDDIERMLEEKKKR